MTEPALLKVLDKMIAAYPNKAPANELFLLVGKQYQGITKLKKYKRVPIYNSQRYYKPDCVILA